MMAQRLSWDSPTIYREPARNRGSDGWSNAVEVQNLADQRALRPKTLKLAAGLERAAW